MHKTQQAVENALILTYRKVKAMNSSSKRMGVRDIAGLFINFYYQHLGIHGGLCTSDITVSYRDDIILFECRESNWQVESMEVSNILKQMTPGNFYSLWLRAEFENPNDGYDSAASTVISVEHFLKQREKSQSII